MSDIPLRHIAVTICQACIDGTGQECHTPGCALWLHRVDLPIDERLIEDLPAHPVEPEVERVANMIGAGLMNEASLDAIARKVIAQVRALSTPSPAPKGTKS